MEIFITVVFVLILLTLIYCGSQLKYIADLLRDEKKPFLREEHKPWTDDMWPEKAPPKKRGRPVGSKNKPKVTDEKSQASF